MQQLKEDDISVALTHEKLVTEVAMNTVRRPQAGAIVLFAGEHGVQPNLAGRSKKPRNYT